MADLGNTGSIIVSPTPGERAEGAGGGTIGRPVDETEDPAIGGTGVAARTGMVAIAVTPAGGGTMGRLGVGICAWEGGRPDRDDRPSVG